MTGGTCNLNEVFCLRFFMVLMVYQPYLYIVIRRVNNAIRILTSEGLVALFCASKK